MDDDCNGFVSMSELVALSKAPRRKELMLHLIWPYGAIDMQATASGSKGQKAGFAYSGCVERSADPA